MTIDRPTLAEISRRIEAEFPLSTTSEALRRTLFTPLARALAGSVHSLYGYQDWIALQWNPLTCDEDVLLSMHVPMWLPDGQNPAESATGTVLITGTAGYSADASYTLSRGDGLLYTIIGGAAIGTDGTQLATVICQTPGATGNTEPGAKLRFSNPVAGINNEVTVQTPGLSGGTDIESIDALRQRVVDARSKAEGVGSSSDWEQWAKEVSGVTRAWAAPKLFGAGSVGVYFVRDNDSGSIFPDTNEVATVQQHLQNTGTPFGEIYALCPIAKPINFSIKLNPDSGDLRTAVTASLTALLAKEGSPVAQNTSGITVVPVTSGATIPLTHIRQVISDTRGEYDHQLVAPAADVVCATGELAQMGTITWL